MFILPQKHFPHVYNQMLTFKYFFPDASAKERIFMLLAQNGENGVLRSKKVINIWGNKLFLLRSMFLLQEKRFAHVLNEFLTFSNFSRPQCQREDFFYPLGQKAAKMGFRLK